jgi:hypothetical protein
MITSRSTRRVSQCVNSLLCIFHKKEAGNENENRPTVCDVQDRATCGL